MKSQVILELVHRLPAAGQSVDAAGKLDEARLSAVLGAARVAPSADNAQTWRFLTVHAEATKERLGHAVADSATGKQLAASHTIVVLCGIAWVVTRARREQPFVFVDVPIALTHMLLQAAELDLTCCWTLDVDEAAVRSALAIPESVRVLALVGLS